MCKGGSFSKILQKISHPFRVYHPNFVTCHVMIGRLTLHKLGQDCLTYTHAVGIFFPNAVQWEKNHMIMNFIRFYEKKNNGCDIMASRPFECQFRSPFCGNSFRSVPLLFPPRVACVRVRHILYWLQMVNFFIFQLNLNGTWILLAFALQKPLKVLWSSKSKTILSPSIPWIMQLIVKFLHTQATQWDEKLSWTGRSVNKKSVIFQLRSWRETVNTFRKYCWSSGFMEVTTKETKNIVNSADLEVIWRYARLSFFNIRRIYLEQIELKVSINCGLPFPHDLAFQNEGRSRECSEYFVATSWCTGLYVFMIWRKPHVAILLPKISSFLEKPQP